MEEAAPLNGTCLKGKEHHGVSWQQKQITNKKQANTMHSYEIWRVGLIFERLNEMASTHTHTCTRTHTHTHTHV